MICIFFRQRLRALQQLGKRLAVVQIADRPRQPYISVRPMPGTLRVMRAREPLIFPSSPRTATASHVHMGFCLAQRLLCAKLPFGWLCTKRFVFRKRLIGDQFIHGGTSPEEYLCVFVIRRDVGAGGSARPSGADVR